MKREPNPYSKNPRLTVTSTMSISVPSMVAEDVLNGTDSPVITVDPNVNDRIDTISGAVELLDTRIDAVSNMSELLYGSCVRTDEALRDRIDTVSGVVDLIDTRIDGVSNMLALNGSGSSSGSADVVLGEDLKKISFNITNNGVLYPSVQGTYESRLNYCSGISCCYFRDPSGGEWIHHAEMRFQKNTSTEEVEIQLRRDDSHDWITVASTADASSSASGGDISFSTRGGTDYSLGFEVDKNADDHSAIVSLTSTGSNEFSGITALSTWLCSPSYTAGNENVFMSVSGMGTLIFKSSGSTVEYDLNNLGGGSGSSEGIAAQSAVKFLSVAGNYSTVQGITLQPYYDYGEYNYDSAIIDLKLDTVSGQEFSGIVALRAGMASPNKSDYEENVTMEVSGMGVLLFQKQGHYESYDLNNLGGDSGSSAPAVAVEDSDAAQAKRLVLSRLSDSRETAGYGWGLRNYRLTAPGTQPSDATAVVYALQTFLAATGMHETVGKLANEAVRTRMALVEGVSQSSTPQFMWWDSDAYKYKKWEPWKEAGSSSSGSTSGSAAGVYELGLLDNGNESASRMLPLVKEQTISDGTSLDILNWAIGWATSNAQETSGMYTLVGNPIALYDSAYRAPNDSRIKGAVRVVDMHGKICWQRYSYTAKQWMIESGDGSSSSGSTSGSAAGVYELGLLDSGSDSGSHMVPLIEETSRALGGDVRSLAAVRWSIGASTTESNDLSGVYTLMANPLALFGHYHDSIDDMHITGAIRPMWTSAGNLAWQKLDYSTKQWKPISTDVKIEITEAYEGIFNVKAEKYDQYQGKNVLVNVPALTSGLGAVFNNTSIVACLKANTATNLRTSGIGIQKTGWDEQYTSFWGGEYDITELVVRAPQICEIASHLSQIRWLCENTASISALINK